MKNNYSSLSSSVPAQNISFVFLVVTEQRPNTKHRLKLGKTSAYTQEIFETVYKSEATSCTCD
jgi:hypothetical protein